MSNFGKGCLYIIICLSLFLGILKFIIGEYLEMLLFPITLFSPILLLMILGIIGNTLSEIIKKGKWLGLGAIFGNIANNKINADASVKSNKSYKKNKIQTNNPIIDKAVEFTYPEIDDIEDNLINDKQYQESE